MQYNSSKQITRTHFNPNEMKNEIKGSLKINRDDSQNVELVKFFSGWSVIIVSFIIAANLSIFAMEKFGAVAGSVTFFASLALLYKPIQSGLKYLQS